MESLVKKRKGWPNDGMQFCTQELKIIPAMRWLEDFDPDGDATCMVGVRREESRKRANWPEWTEESDKHGGRSLWAPLVRHTEEMRNELIIQAGFDVLPHRSEECFPCINDNRSELCRLTEDRIAEIERIETEMGYTSNGKPRTMFRPYKKMGAIGIREVYRWACSERGKYEPLIAINPSCDSGMCGG